MNSTRIQLIRGVKACLQLECLAGIVGESIEARPPRRRTSTVGVCVMVLGMNG